MILAWWVVLTAAICCVAAAGDAVLQLSAGYFAGVVLLTHLAIAIVIASVLVLPIGALSAVHDRLGGSPRAQRIFGPLLAAMATVAILWRPCEPLQHKAWPAYVAAVIMAACANAACVWVTRMKADPPYLRSVATGLVVVAMIALDPLIPNSTYFEFHVAAHWITRVAVACTLDPLRDYAQKRMRPRYALLIPFALIAAMTHLLTADRLYPAWRSTFLPTTHHLSTLTHMLRKTLDFDGDGFSAIAWGTDCNDFDKNIHPRAIDRPGQGDENCNQVDPSPNPTDEDRGLTAPKGQSNLPSGNVDLAILITVDALRADCFRESLMPNTVEFARRGITFTNMYALGSSTLWSVPLMLLATEQSEPIATQFEGESITVSAFASGNDNIDYAALGFPRLNDDYQNCQGVVDAALAKIHDVGRAPHFMWLYCFDPHEPYQLRREYADHAALEMDACGDSSESAVAYRSEVAATDAAIGKLITELEKSGRIDRTALVVTGDHGEFFGEHGQTTHAHSAWQPVLRVPAMFVAPGMKPTVYSNIATHRDIPATMLGALGLAGQSEKAEAFGRSWLRIPADPSYPLHSFVVSRTAYWSSGMESTLPLGVINDGRYKLVVSYDERTFELYDLRNDPKEETNLHAREPARVERMARQLAIYGDLDEYPARSHLRWRRY